MLQVGVTSCKRSCKGLRYPMGPEALVHPAVRGLHGACMQARTLNLPHECHCLARLGVALAYHTPAHQRWRQRGVQPLAHPPHSPYNMLWLHQAQAMLS